MGVPGNGDASRIWKGVDLRTRIPRYMVRWRGDSPAHFFMEFECDENDGIYFSGGIYYEYKVV